jgi:hypothetical protein
MNFLLLVWDEAPDVDDFSVFVDHHMCIQQRFASRDPYMQMYQSLQEKLCRLLLKIAKFCIWGPLICIQAGIVTTFSKIGTYFAYGDPRLQMVVVCI